VTDLMEVTVFGLGTVAIVYWLVQHARRVKLITDPRLSYLVPGIVWAILVLTYVFVPQAGQIALFILGGWAATLLFKAGAKDNERAGGE
jgi:hypothetical protein